MNKKCYYVYQIKNILTGRKYIGSRCCYGEPSNDLGIKYFSSSTDKDFINEQKKNRNNFEYIIIKKFDNRDDAILYESELHVKYDVMRNPCFYNKANQGKIINKWESPKNQFCKFHTYKEVYGEDKGVELAKNHSNAMKGKPFSEEHKKNLANSNRKRVKGKTFEEIYGIEIAQEIKQKLKTPRSDETKRKISEARTGYKCTEEAKQHISNGLRKRYKDPEYKKKFTETMTRVNQNIDKREKAGKVIKELWQTTDFLNKMKNRKHRRCKVIEVTYPNGDIKTFNGLNKMCEANNFNKSIVRKYLKCGGVIPKYIGVKKSVTFSTDYVNLEGYKFVLKGYTNEN